MFVQGSTAPLSIQLPANMFGKFAEESPRTWALTLRQETQIALGFGLAQFWVLQPFLNHWMDALFFLFFLSLTLPFK